LQDWVVGAKAKPEGIPTSMIAFEGKSEFGVKAIVRVVSAYTYGEATDATLNVTATPVRSGEGLKFVYFPSIK